MNFKCPDCGKPLMRVRQSASSPLNAEQFDAAKAGDFYCESCPGNDRGNSPHKYFWKNELLDQCTHEDFSANVRVIRLADCGRFYAEVRIECSVCKVPIRFIGLPAGLDLNGASISVDATEARLAIAPKGEVVSLLDGAPMGFSIRNETAKENTDEQ